MLGTLALLLFVGLIVAYPLVAFALSLWHLAGRPIALRLGVVVPTRDDLVVKGWSAERGGQWADALAAYEDALLLRQWDQDAEARRAQLLQHHPELAEEAERAQRKRLAALSPQDAFCYLAHRPSDRKLRLAAAALCRCACGAHAGDRVRAAIERVESHADQPNPASKGDAAESLSGVGAEGGESHAPDGSAVLALHMALWMPVVGAIDALVLAADVAVRDDQVRLLECLFGLRGRTQQAAPAWRTDTVVTLARQMYEARDFGAMPILADALQDAGCDSADVLAHCRGPGPHVRGCWVCDLVLERE